MKGLTIIVICMALLAFWTVKTLNQKTVNEKYTLNIVFQNGQKDTMDVWSGALPYFSDEGSIFLSPNGHINFSPTLTGVRSVQITRARTIKQ